MENWFIKSILFYPILFAVSALVLFLITSSVDHSFPTGYSIDIGYIDPLIFTGSPDAARAILSAIILELSIIIDKILTTRNVSLIYHVVSQYITQCRNLIREGKHEEFRLLSDWCSGQLSLD
jgi:hypothetical protein